MDDIAVSQPLSETEQLPGSFGSTACLSAQSMLARGLSYKDSRIRWAAAEGCMIPNSFPNMSTFVSADNEEPVQE